MSFGGDVRNVMHLPNGLVVYDIRVPRPGLLGWLGLEYWETRIGVE